MKRQIISLIAFVVMGMVAAFAQSSVPALSYQSVVRDAQNRVVINQENITVTASVWNAAGTSEQYRETHTGLATNANGLLTFMMGTGTPDFGTWAGIDWSDASVITSISYESGNGTVIVTSQPATVTAVPFALQAANAPTSVSDLTNDAGYLTSSSCTNVDFCTMAEALPALQSRVEQLHHLLDSLTGNTVRCPGTPTVTDFDGNVYNTVQIGNQCWMRENMRTTHYADGTEIPAGNSNYSEIDPFRYAPSGDGTYVATYGYLYNWPATMKSTEAVPNSTEGTQGICPTGWHVPSRAEWTQLFDYVSSRSEYVCGDNNANIAKALSATTGWHNQSGDCLVGNNPSANNATGFSTLPAGINEFGSYSWLGEICFFWTSTVTSISIRAYDFRVRSDRVAIESDSWYGWLGESVRCLRD